MDISAYMKIEDLDAIAKENGIDVPRLRGYRLMRDEIPYTEEEIEKEIESELSHAYRSIEDICARMMECAQVHDITGYEANKSWLSMYENIAIAFAREFKNQCETYNKYCGRDDVLMIHSRMGGTWYWDYDENGEKVKYDLKEQPWFLDHVYDAFDGTYCDIYAKIKPIPKV